MTGSLPWHHKSPKTTTQQSPQIAVPIRNILRKWFDFQFLVINPTFLPTNVGLSGIFLWMPCSFARAERILH
ncbi:MAG TPA: hypothetical protein DEF45_04945 [Rhodopirellula sp.]|nr:hypothetical protein [Rhodopirellula sp.]